MRKSFLPLIFKRALVIASLLNSLQGCGKIKGARATASSIYGSLMCLPQQSFFHKHNHCTTSTQVRDIHPQPTLLYSLLHLSPFSNPKSSDNGYANFFSTLFLRVVIASLSDRRPFGHPKSLDNRGFCLLLSPRASSPPRRRHCKVRIAEIGQQPKFRPQKCFSEKRFAKDHRLYLHQNSLVKVVLSFGYVFDIVMLSKNV
jgi:hypothetical protein